MKPKKILFLVPYGFNDRMSNFVEYVSARLLAKNGWQVTVIVRSDNNQTFRENVHNILIYRYGSTLVGVTTLIKVFFSFRPTIVHFHNLRNNRVGIAGSMMARLLRKKLFFTEYGMLHDHYLVEDRDRPLPIKLNPQGVIKSFGQAIKSKNNFKNYLFHWPMSHADNIVFVSKHNVPIVKALGFDENVSYLPQILDDVSWDSEMSGSKKKSEDDQQRINIKMEDLKGRKYVVFVGQIKLRKGWDVLLKAIRHVDKSILPYFVFISSSPDSSVTKYTKMVDNLKVSDRAIFLGRIFDRSLLKDVLEGSQAIIVPSRYEGFGLLTTEAFDLKKPLIAADVIAINETVKSGYNGLLFPVEDHKALAGSIAKLVQDPELQNTLINGGEATLKKFKSQETKKLWIDFYYNQI